MAKALRLLELTAILVLALYCVVPTIPGYRLLGRAAGTFGMDWGVRPGRAGVDALTVTAVEPNSAAARAGVLPGDYLPPQTTLYQRYAAVQASLPGTSRAFALERDGAPHPVTLVAQPGRIYFPNDAFTRFFMIVRIPEALLLGLVAFLLVLRAPSKMSWGLALFLLSNVPSALAVRSFESILDPLAEQIFEAIYGALGAFGHMGALVFALRFPRGEVRGIAAIVDRLAWPLAAILAVGRWTGTRILSFYVPASYGFASEAMDRIVQLLPWVAAIVLIYTLMQSQGVERRRLQWVVVGVALGCIVQPLNSLSSSLHTPLAIDIARSLGLATGVVPLLVAYGVLRHRILDVGFVINRAAVYAAVTALLIAVLGLVKLAAGEYLKGSWSAIVQVATAIGLGLSTQRIYKAADWLVDRYFFPSAHATEERLKRLGDGLKYARSTDAIAGALVDEAADALNLAACALFRRRPDGSFVRRAATGWEDAEVTEIAASDPLVLYLEGDESHFDVRAVLKNRAGFPTGIAAPQHAFPLLVARELAGFALYSEHQDGTAIDPDEIAMLDKLVKAAGDGYHPLIRVKAALRDYATANPPPPSAT